MKKIPLTQGQFALVDDSDFESVSRFRWCAVWSNNTKSFYASRHEIKNERRNRKRKMISMHRFILGLTDRNVYGDHRNHDTLDNRRENLRQTTVSQNCSHRKGLAANNTSGHRGVRKRGNRFITTIGVNKKLIHIGSFETVTEAVVAYGEANRKYFGEFGGTIK